MLKFTPILLMLIATCKADVKSGKANALVMNDDHEIPVLGLGTWLNGSSPDSTQKAVEVAIENGYRHIDTAAIYGTEQHVGKAVLQKIKDGIIKRHDIFITTKLWNTDHARDKVVPALRKSLENLQMNYVDLYLIHWPIAHDDYFQFTDEDYVETWKGMEEALALGLTKSIGVSNFNISQLDRLLANSKVKPVCNQVEVNPTFTQKKLIKYCNEKDIKIVAYTPLGVMPESRSKDKETPPPHLDDPILTEIGKKYNKTTVQVVLRYLIDSGLIPIPKSSTPSRIIQNIDVFDFALTPEEVKKVDDFNIDKRTVNPTIWSGSKYYPFEV